MIRNFTLLLAFLVIAGPALAQVQDRTITNCDQQTESVFQVLNQGKILLIASQNLDCKTCQVSASSLNSFATNHRDNIRVWSALYLDNEASDCVRVNDWVRTYNYSDVFAFPDPARAWTLAGQNHYTVINPLDQTIFYEGDDQAAALQQSLELEKQLLANPEFSGSAIEFSVSPNPFNSTLTVEWEGRITGDLKLELMNLLGETMISRTIPQHLVSKDVLVKELSSLNNGYYFLRFTMGEVQQTIRLVKN